MTSDAELITELRSWPGAGNDALSSATVSDLLNRAADALERAGERFPWPEIDGLVMPRNETLTGPGAVHGAPEPALEALAEMATPWNVAYFAGALRSTGVRIPRRAEAEYAVALYWLLGHALRSGAGWRAAAVADLDTRKTAADASVASA
jgi:hypothetical protein